MSAALRRLTLAPALALIAATVPGSPARGDFQSDNVTLLSHIEPESFPGAPNRGNDCWGYVSPSGREYALMGMRNAMNVVEITDPSFPTIVASIDHLHSNWSDIKTYQTYAYVVNEEGGGIDVVDLGDVDNGNVTLVQRVTAGGVQSSHNVVIDEASGFLYLSGSNLSNGRLVAFDLVDPANPVLVGQLPVAQGEYSHDAQVVTYTDGPYAGKQIAFSADGAFGMSVYDVTDKANMVRMSNTMYPNLGYAHQCWLSEDRQYLYLNDELDGVNETVIFGVTDLLTPTVAGTFSPGGEAIDHNLYCHQGLIYEADYTAGLRIYDAADPLAPVAAGYFDTFPGADAAEFGGAWSVYPFFPSGNVLISTKREGLFVVRPGPAPLLFDFALPTRIDPAGDTMIVQITPQGGQTLTPDSPTLHYDAGSGVVTTPMTALGGNLYEGTFGPTPCGVLVKFHVSARTTSNITMTDPAGAPAAFHAAVAAHDATTTLDDDMEDDLGWVAGLPGDTATEGVWLRVEPQGTFAQPEADHTPGAAELCYVTGQGNPNGLEGDADVDEGFTRLLSPAFDLADVDDAIVSYWRWYSNDWQQLDSDEGTAPNEDVFLVEITGDGLHWMVLETVGPAGPGTSGGSIFASFNVADFLTPGPQVRLRFTATDAVGFSIVEAAIDDVRVEVVDCILFGDIDDDGLVNVNDLVALITAWGPCADCDACAADLDGDCDIDVDDLVALILNWS